MAAPSSSQDAIQYMHEEATCSLCQDYFKDPVSLECGHNFCKACLTQFWETLGTTETICPQCRESVLQRNLKPNQQLANMVEIIKKLICQVGKRRRSWEDCEQHQGPLKLFCMGEETPICVASERSMGHEGQTAIPVEEAAQVYKRMVNHQNVLNKETEKILTYKAEVEKEAQYLLKETEEMEKALGEIIGIRMFLENREKHIRAQMKELKKQIARKRDENMAIFDQELSSLKNLIQEMKEKCQQPPAELLQDGRSFLERVHKKKTFKKPVAFPPKFKRNVWMFCDLRSGLAAILKSFQDTLRELKLQKANITLDPDTAGSWLVLSEDAKSVTYEDKYQVLPDNPERFSYPTYVLGREGFTTGRHFWDVFVGNVKQWAVGVAKKSVRREGAVHLDPEGGIWAVGKKKGIYHATSHPSSSVLSLNVSTKRIRVYLNCAANRVAFYDVDTGDQIYVLSEIPFSGETILPFFWLNASGHLKIL